MDSLTFTLIEKFKDAYSTVTSLQFSEGEINKKDRLVSSFGITERELRVGKLGWHENLMRNLTAKINGITGNWPSLEIQGDFFSRKTN